MKPVVFYESDTQIIIGVTLPDGREFSIDLKKHNVKPEAEETILVSGDYMGVAAK